MQQQMNAWISDEHHRHAQRQLQSLRSGGLGEGNRILFSLKLVSDKLVAGAEYLEGKCTIDHDGEPVPESATQGRGINIQLERSSRAGSRPEGSRHL